MTDKSHLRELFSRASQDTDGDARLELFRALNGVELFYLAKELQVDGQSVWSTPLRTLDDGSRAMTVYTYRSHPGLSSAFVGALWSQVLAVAHEAVSADWLVLVNRDNATVAIARDQIPVIRADLSESNGVGLAAPEPPTDDLETTIANSVGASSERWYAPALERLRGRELYLHLTEDVSAAGRPSIRTSAEAGRDGWILTYTTRDRPGITYGGITWEELVKMIKRDETMPGVRVVTKSDDWIILGRDVM